MIIARLHTGYHESISALGLSATGGVMELYTSEDGTWTLILTQPNGMSCLVAVGEGWQDIPSVKYDET